jgi:aldehyde dehydrogenase (NAD+)
MDANLMMEEIFGPVMPIIPINTISQAIDIINSKPKPLTVYYFGEPNSKNAARLSAETSSGAFVTNECTVHVISNYTGFGGVGESGYGRHGGYEGFK